MSDDFVNDIVKKTAQNARQQQPRPPARQPQQQSQKQPSQQRGSKGSSSPKKQVMSMAKKLANMPPQKRFAAIKKGLKKNPKLAKKVIKVLKKKGVAVKPGKAQSQQTQKQQGKPQKKPVQTGGGSKKKVMMMAKKLSKMPPQKRRAALKKGMRQKPKMAKKVMKVLKKKGVPVKPGQQNGQKGSGSVDPNKMLSTMVKFMKSEKGQKLIGQIASSQIDDVKKDIEEKKQKLKKLTDSKAKLRLLAEELLNEKKNNNDDDKQETRKAKTNATPDEVSNKLSDELSSKFKTAAQNSEGLPSIEEIEQALLATEGSSALLTPEKSLENPKKTATYAGVSRAFEKTSQDSDALPMLAGAGLGTVGGMYAANRGLFEDQAPAADDVRINDTIDDEFFDNAGQADDAAGGRAGSPTTSGLDVPDRADIGFATEPGGDLPRVDLVDVGQAEGLPDASDVTRHGNVRVEGISPGGNLNIRAQDGSQFTIPKEQARLYHRNNKRRINLVPKGGETFSDSAGIYSERQSMTPQYANYDNYDDVKFDKGLGMNIPESTAKRFSPDSGGFWNKFKNKLFGDIKLQSPFKIVNKAG